MKNTEIIRNFGVNISNYHEISQAKKEYVLDSLIQLKQSLQIVDTMKAMECLYRLYIHKVSVEIVDFNHVNPISLKMENRKFFITRCREIENSDRLFELLERFDFNLGRVRFEY